MPTLPIFHIPGSCVGVGTFKLIALQRYGNADIRGFYGNVRTDTWVAQTLGIPTSRTFIVGKLLSLPEHSALLSESLEPAKVPGPMNDPWWF
jgi:hypothetical protein